MLLLFTIIDHISDASNHSLFNLPVQATGADGFKLALIHISGKLNGLDARIVHTQHDAIILEARGDIADQSWTILKESMEEALKTIIPEVPFVAEIRMAEGKAFSSLDEVIHDSQLSLIGLRPGASKRAGINR